jgi:hypothetical protein
MVRFLIESPHTKEECLKALDEVIASGRGAIDEYEYGCMDGEHAGYLIVEADSRDQALRKVPEFLKGKARVVQLNKFTEEEVRKFHEESA